jgi:hypothetical protein
MDARTSGRRKIRWVTWAVAVAGVYGSVAFAGLARAATKAPKTNPTDGSVVGPQVDQPGQQNQPPRLQRSDQQPFVRSGGS